MSSLESAYHLENGVERNQCAFVSRQPNPPLYMYVQTLSVSNICSLVHSFTNNVAFDYLVRVCMTSYPLLHICNCNYLYKCTSYITVFCFVFISADGGFDCNSLSTIANGNVTTSALSVGSVAEYNCEPGFTLTGPVTRTCEPAGVWSGLEPVCMSKLVHLLCNYVLMPKHINTQYTCKNRLFIIQSDQNGTRRPK